MFGYHIAPKFKKRRPVWRRFIGLVSQHTTFDAHASALMRHLGGTAGVSQCPRTVGWGCHVCKNRPRAGFCSGSKALIDRVFREINAALPPSRRGRTIRTDPPRGIARHESHYFTISGRKLVPALFSYLYRDSTEETRSVEVRTSNAHRLETMTEMRRELMSRWMVLVETGR